jgi:hypothetical protein
MGTATDWLGVFLLGTLYGGGMFFFPNRTKDNLQLHVFPALVLVYVFAGLSCGIVLQFHFSQAFRWPLILVTLSAMGAFVVAAFYLGVKRRGASPSQPLA